MAVFRDRVLCWAIWFLLTGSPPAFADTPPLAFHPGERLRFELKWTVIPAGEAVLEVCPMAIVNDTPAYHFTLRVLSNAFVDQFYMVRDQIDSYVDTSMNHSVYYEKRQLEGKTRRHEKIRFNWNRNQAEYSNFDQDTRRIPLMPGSFDPLSIFFYARTQEPGLGLTISRPVTDGKKNVLGKASYIQQETIQTRMGTYETIRIEPELTHIGGVFEKSESARIQIWLTADSRRLPVKLSSKVVVGSFTAELIGIESNQAGIGSLGRYGGIR